MTTTHTPNATRPALPNLAANPWAWGLLIALVLSETFSHVALPALIAVEKARESRSVAKFADIKQQAESRLLEQQAKVERERAYYARALKSAEADAAATEAEIARDEYAVQQEVAKQSSRVQRLTAEKEEILAAMTRATNLVQSGNRPACLNCFIRR